MASTYEKVATYTAPSAQSNYTFTTISQAYTDLVLIISGSLSAADYVWFRVGNGAIDSGSNYSHTAMTGNGSTATSSRSSNATYFFQPDPMNTSINTVIANFQNYSNTSTYKTILMRSNTPANDGGATGTTNAEVALWRSTSAINYIQVSTYAGANFTTGTTFTLYGIKAA